MATKKNLEYGKNEPQIVKLGSQGSGTTSVQQALNRSGYNLEEDGIFGQKTLEAVKDYQSKNGLTVDGIVGKNTWASLVNQYNGASNNSALATNATAANGAKSATNTAGTIGTGFEYKDFSYDDFNYDKEFSYDNFQHDAYQESEAVTAAKQALEAQMANKPGEYQSQWQNQLNDAINKILNREQFSYDFNGDALYQQYKDKYIQQGKMAMADTMGQAAAMTGGYGNSYAAMVGNQAYQQSLQQLNDVVPELYQMAYDRYNQEGQDLYNQYAMLGERENADYGRYRDSMSDWQTERDYLTNRYDTERNLDYSKYTDDRNFAYNQYANDRNFAYGKYVDDRNYEYGKYVDDRNFAYNQYADDKSYAYTDYRNQIGDAQWQATFDEGVRQYNEQFGYQQERDKVADSQWQATFDEGVRQYNEQFEYQQGRDAVADSQWDKTFQYQQDRDAVADSQWNQSFQYQKDRDAVSDSQWNQSFQYQQDRDKVADSQWQATFDEGVRQYNEQFGYQKDRDAVSDTQWNQSFQYQQDRDKVSDSQWDKTFQYQQDRDAVADSQWQTAFDYTKDRDQVSDSQWQQEFNRATANDAANRTENNAKTYYESGGKVGYDNGSVSLDNIKLMQKALGIDADGKWGPGSTEASGGLTADQAWKAYQNGTLGKADAGYDDIVADIDYFLSKGEGRTEIKAYLDDALKAGNITATEYDKLKNKYIPASTGGGGNNKIVAHALN